MKKIIPKKSIIIAILIFIALGAIITYAATGGGWLFKSAETKGLVANLPLDADSAIVGSENVTNGTFEVDATTGWTGNSSGGAPTTWTRNTTSPIAGVADLHAIRGSGTGSKGDYTTFSVTSGKSYILTFTARVLVGTLYVNGTDSNHPTTNTFSGFGSIMTQTSSTNTKYTRSFQAGATGTFYLHVYFTSFGDTDEFYIDNISFKEVTGAQDKTPNAKNGTLTGTTFTTDRDGQTNRATSFDGSNDYINMPTGMIAYNSNATFSTWFKTASSTNQAGVIGNDINSSTNFSYNVCGGIVYLNGILWGTVYSANNYQTISQAVSLNQWYHVVFVRDITNSQIKLYVNGALINTVAFTPASLGVVSTVQFCDTNYFKIGRHSSSNTGGPYQYLSADLSDARVYNRALSAGEVSQLYSSYRPTAHIGSQKKGLVGQWMLDSDNEKNFSYAEFNGSSAYIDVSPTINTCYNSISAWINVDTTASTQAFVGKQYDPPISNWGWGLSYQSGYLRGMASALDTSWYDNLKYALSAGQWYHVALVFTGFGSSKTGTLYVNGAAVATYTGTSACVGQYYFLLGAGQNATPNGFLDGKMTDVRVYNDTLTASEVATLADKRNINKSTPTIDNLVAWWTMGDYYDASGNGYTGTNYNTVITKATTADATPNGNIGTIYGANYATDQKGQANRALGFVKAYSQYVRIPNSSTVQLSTNAPFTITYWMKVNSLDSLTTSIAKGGFSSGYSHLLTNTNKGLYIYTTGDVNPDLTVANYFLTSDIGTNTWIFVSQTYDGNIIKLYKNNVLAGTSSSGITLATNSSPLYIGCDSGSTYFFDGSIADVRLYNNVLTTDEMTNIYNSYRPKMSSGSLTKGLVGEWTLKSKSLRSSTVMGDSTPNGNHGTLVGTTVGADSTALNGTSDYISIPSTTSLNANSAITISFWMNAATNNYGGNYNGMIGKNTDADWNTNKSGWSFNFPGNGKIQFVIGNGSALITTLTTNTYDDYTWHHVVGAWSGGLLKIYIDGQEAAYDAQGTTTTSLSNTTEVRIGQYAFTAGRYFKGSLSNVRIYNRELTAAEIKLLYDKGR